MNRLSLSHFAMDTRNFQLYSLYPSHSKYLNLTDFPLNLWKKSLIKNAFPCKFAAIRFIP